MLVNPDDDRRLMGYYPTLAGETETYLTAKASEQGLVMDGQPLVRFIVDEDLKHGKFDIIAEAVAAPIIAQLRAEEMHRYGLAAAPAPGGYGAPAQRPQAPAPQQYGGYNQGYAAPAPAPAPYGGYDQYEPAPMNVDAYGQPQQLPYVPEDEIDRSIDYGEYTFDSRDFDEQRDSIQPLDRPEAVDPFAIGAAAAGAGVAAGAVAGAGMGAATSQPYPPAAATAGPAAHGRRNCRVRRRGSKRRPPMPRAGPRCAPRLIDTTNNRAYDLASGAPAHRPRVEERHCRARP